MWPSTGESLPSFLLNSGSSSCRKPWPVLCRTTIIEAPLQTSSTVTILPNTSLLYQVPGAWFVTVLAAP